MSPVFFGHHSPVHSYVRKFILLMFVAAIHTTSFGDAPPEVLTIEDTPSFSTSGQSIWGPTAGTQIKTFKEDIINVPETSGTLGEVWGGSVSLDTANLVGNSTFLCPVGQVWVVGGGG